MSRTLIKTVLEDVADREGVPIEELDEPLYESVDPDSLATIVEDDLSVVRFNYHGYTVTVRDEDDISVGTAQEVHTGQSER